MMALAVLLYRHSDEYRCQHRKDESLDESDQYLYTADEQRKWYRNSSAQSCARKALACLAKYKDQTDQT